MDYLQKGYAIYESNAQNTWVRFSSHLTGSSSGLVGIVSNYALGIEARTALESSACALGFGEASCCFCTLHPHNTQEMHSKSTPLESNELFMLIEGCDPLVLVATDATAALALSKTYSTDVVPLTRSRIFGRTAVAFQSFESMLATSNDKQRAWAILKLLRETR